MLSVGIDVSKSKLSCAFQDEVREFANSRSGFVELAKWAHGAVVWCMEATGRYHEELAMFVYSQGLRCVVVNPGAAKKYLDFVKSRSKTDRVDALGLARLGELEGEHLRPFRPVPELVATARDILVRRRTLVESRASIRQVLGEVGDAGGHLSSSIKELSKAVISLERELADHLKSDPSYVHLQTIPGVGPMSAAALWCALEKGEFITSDSLVAYAGLDPKASDSGTKRGTRRLSHQGDGHLRAILFMAARAGSRTEIWKAYYESQKAKGLSSTACTVILARKLIRVAWSVYKQKTPFVDKRVDKLT